MKVTLMDIANEAGVSVATVSYALNKTKYVSPELTDKIQTIALQRGYVGKNEPKGKSKKYIMGKLSEIDLVVPSDFCRAHVDLISLLSKEVDNEGYILSIYLFDGNEEQEAHILSEIASNKRVAGIILSPSKVEAKFYKKLINTLKPLVCLEGSIDGEVADSVTSDNEKGICEVVENLVKSGHERIALLLEECEHALVNEQKQGYLLALRNFEMECDSELITSISFENDSDVEEQIKRFIKDRVPTAIVAGGNKLTISCLKTIEKMGLQCPKDISVVGFGNDNWCELYIPPLTTLAQNAEAVGKQAVDLLMKRISSTEDGVRQAIRVPMLYTTRKSILNISRGPFGEKVVYPDENFLSEEEVERLKQNHFTVAISFHYSGNEWTRLHEKAIKDTLNNYGVRVLSVTDANFEPELQNTQLEGLIMQHPDAIIAVPTDEIKTADKFREISKKTKLVLINNMPNSLTKNDYSCWISVNERENGQNAGQILIEHFSDQDHVKIGMLTHGTSFFATRQRDFFAEQVLRDNNPNLSIVSKRNFYTIDNAYDVCKRMVENHPEIQGIYVTWDRPALQAIKALKDLGRTDISISTTDLDYEIASYLANKNMVVGISSQRPYDQGVAVATATAKALLGNNENTCIGVRPYTVSLNNLEKAWKELLKTEVPEFVLSDY